MSNELAPIADLDFGNLVVLPELYAASKERVEKAKAYAAEILKPVSGIDLYNVDAIKMEANMVPVRELRTLLAEATEEVKAARMPHTKKMDAIKSLFTGIEAEFSIITDSVKTIENTWEAEKLRRHNAQAAAADLEIKKRQAAIDIKTYAFQMMTNAFTRAITAEILGMNKAYNAKTAEELPAYGEVLHNWVPELDADTWQCICPIKVTGLHHTDAECADIVKAVIDELWPQMSAEWATKVNEDKERLVDLIPSRIAELNEAASNEEANRQMQERLAQEQQQITSSLQADASNKTEAANLEADTQKMNGSFEVAAAAVPVVAMSFGTSVKKKYKVTTHSGMIALLQSFIKHDMPLMTIEEMNTKFSFVRTANDKRLNKGETIEAKGLEVVDDITTRRTSSKAS